MISRVKRTLRKISRQAFFNFFTSNELTEEHRDRLYEDLKDLDQDQIKRGLVEEELGDAHKFISRSDSILSRRKNTRFRKAGRAAAQAARARRSQDSIDVIDQDFNEPEPAEDYTGSRSESNQGLRRQITSIRIHEAQPELDLDQHLASISENFTEIEQKYKELMEVFSVAEISTLWNQIKSLLNLPVQSNFNNTFYALKQIFTQWRLKEIMNNFDQTLGQKNCYFPTSDSDSENQKRSCHGINAVIIGAGPVGLRYAIELALLGANVTVIEKRDSFSRNNMLKLWKSAARDLIHNLQIKKFYPKFNTGEVEHISIHRLQEVLYKICLLFGVDVRFGVKYCQVLEPNETNPNETWKISCQPMLDDGQHYVHQAVDLLVGAEGKMSLVGSENEFELKERGGQLCLGITANLALADNREDLTANEIPGLTSYYNRPLFDRFKNEAGVDLENFVYYRNEYHYVVMTVTPQSLLETGCLIEDLDRTDLVRQSNINFEAVENLVRDVVNIATDGKLATCEFLKKSDGETNDLMLFDFSQMYHADKATNLRQVSEDGQFLLCQLVGDSLLNPFWPLGTGIGRGFQGVFDSADLAKYYFENFNRFVEQLERGEEALISDEDRLALYENWRWDAVSNITYREKIYQSIYTSLDNENGLFGEDRFDQFELEPKSRYRLAYAQDLNKQGRYPDRDNAQHA